MTNSCLNTPMVQPQLTRNLVVCMDGTSNEFKVDSNTNVVRLRESLVCDAAKQLVYYDSGVGTLPEPGIFSRIGQKLNRWWSLAFGTGLMRNVEEAYTYLMNYWEPGDRVFLFGFSRGAYSARVLAGLLHALGLLPRGSENLTPYICRLFGGTRIDSSYWRLCNKVRRTLARPIENSPANRFLVHFMGVWDTVSSVGWVWDPKSYPHTRHNPSVAVIRHAVALDERRSFFRQNLFRQAEGQDFDERWFPGSHADVGGGYATAEGGIWRVAFEWMLNEARRCGLLIDEGRLARVLNPPVIDPWAETIHESLTYKWWPAELFPKCRGMGRRSCSPRCGLGRRREVGRRERLDRSVLFRIRKPGLGYAPSNLSEDFVNRVRALGDVPDTLVHAE